MVQKLWETVYPLAPQDIKHTRLPHDPELCPRHIWKSWRGHSNKHWYMNIHSSTTYHSLQWKQPKYPSADGQINKYSIFIQLSSHTKECRHVTWVDLVLTFCNLAKRFAKWKKPDIKRLDKTSEISKHVERENSDGQGWAGRREGQGAIANECGVSFWYIANASELNRGDSCPTLGMY